MAGLQEQEEQRDAVGRQEDTVRTIELVEEAGEGAEEIMNNISSAGAKRCAPAFVRLVPCTAEQRTTRLSR